MRSKIVLFTLLAVVFFTAFYIHETVLGPNEVKIYKLGQTPFIYSPQTYPSYGADSVYFRFFMRGINRYQASANYDSVQAAIWLIGYPFSDKTIGTPTTTLLMDTVYLWVAHNNTKDTVWTIGHPVSKQWSQFGYKLLLFGSRGTSDSADTRVRFVGEASIKQTP